MAAFLLDTNVISEITKPERDPAVMAFLSGLQDGYLSIITIHELEFGLRRLSPGRRRAALTKTVAQCLSLYQDCVLPLGIEDARLAAQFRVEALTSGRTLHLADAFIAATAARHGLTLATRNQSDFAGLPVSLFNPWQG